MATFFGGTSEPKVKPVQPATDTQASEKQAKANRRTGALSQVTNLSNFRTSNGTGLAGMYSAGKSTLGAG